jgi:NADPH-dependent curcumin reductase
MLGRRLASHIEFGSSETEETRMPTNTQILLDQRPTGKVSPANFRIVETPIPEPGPGEVLVRHTFLSLDPYMRGRLSDAKSYAKPQEVGAVMGGGTVGLVEASNNTRFHPGDAVVGMGGWQRYSVSDGATLRVIDAKAVPIQAYLGALGMPGVTAWYGLNQIIAPEKNETVVVSAATGAVGSVVGQLAKIAGARAVGIAGGPDKCAYAVRELGYDACVDHKSPNFAEELKEALPNGIDGLFENVGGEPFQLAMRRRLNDFARVAVCGLIASYEGAPTALPDMRIFLVKRFKMEGFIVSDHLDLWPKAIGELVSLAAANKLTWRETIREGIENAPQALVDLLKGENFGKMLVRVN